MELEGRVAVITGGASGIGKASGSLLARNGMRVVLADIEQNALDQAVKELVHDGLEVSGVVADVSRLDSMQAAADTVFAGQGNVHALILNAGVAPSTGGRLWEQDVNDWAWGMAVNLWGVINGIKAFLPHMVDAGEPGQVVITSSSVGVVAPSKGGPVYAMTKAAVTSIGETLYGQLREAGSPISVSVLVPPGTINTGLFTSRRNRQAEFEPVEPRDEPAPVTYAEMLARMNARGNPRRPIEPEEVAEYVLDAVRDGTFWVLPNERHPDARDNFDRIIRARADALLERGDPMTYLQ
jgi:NAD(P)-dependent dehydrogenase (short-subunit alcohol dehydrogenase family)